MAGAGSSSEARLASPGRHWQTTWLLLCVFVLCGDHQRASQLSNQQKGACVCIGQIEYLVIIDFPTTGSIRFDG